VNKIYENAMPQKMLWISKFPHDLGTNTRRKHSNTYHNYLQLGIMFQGNNFLLFLVAILATQTKILLSEKFVFLNLGMQVQL